MIYLKEKKNIFESLGTTANDRIKYLMEKTMRCATFLKWFQVHGLNQIAVDPTKHARVVHNR